MDGILGTNAPLKSDLTLIAYIVVLMPGMLLGFYFARRKMFFPHHKLVMTTVTLMNWALIIALMFVSYRDFVAPFFADNRSDVRYWLPTLHLLTGGIAQLLATYLVILMWTERTRFENWLPYRIKKIKTPMRLTLGLWLTTIILGFGIYAAWWAPSAATASDAPISTEEASLSSTEEAASEATAMPDPISTEETTAEPLATEEATFKPESTANALPETTEDAAFQFEFNFAEGVTPPAATEPAGAEPVATEEASPTRTPRPTRTVSPVVTEEATSTDATTSTRATEEPAATEEDDSGRGRGRGRGGDDPNETEEPDDDND